MQLWTGKSINRKQQYAKMDLHAAVFLLFI